MPRKPAFSLPRLLARAITYLLIFTSFWYFDAFMGSLRTIAEAQAKPPAPAPYIPPVVFRVPQSTLPIQLTRISTGFNGLVGMDWHPVQDKLLVSVDWPYNGALEVIDHDGNHTRFGNITGLGDEVYLAVARSTMGGFQVGDTFCGGGRPGEIIRISPDGQTVQNPWVKLPNEQGILRGGLHVDETGVWGGDLIVITNTGGIWRVNSLGQPQILANVHDLVEGPTTVPNDPVRYGPWAGTIVCGSEASGRLYSIDRQGNVRIEPVGGSPEAVHVVPPNQNFFASCFGIGAVVGAPSVQFANYIGDVIYTEEFSGDIWVMRWDGTAFQRTQIGHAPSQLEGSCFAPVGIVEVPPVSPPPTITCTPPQTLNATSPDGAPATISFQTNAEGCTLLQVTWKVDGFPIERVDTFAATGEPPSSGSASHTRVYAPGSHTITLITKDMLGQTGTVQTSVTVIAQPPTKTLTSIAVTPPTTTLNIGQTSTLTATGTYSDGSTADVTALAGWSSGSASIALADPGGVIRGVAPGTATISASLDGVTGTASVTVVKSLVSIAVTPATSQLSVGQTVQLTATGTYNDGSTADLTGIATWSSNATSFVTVGATGLARGVAVGSAAITAGVAGISGSAQVTVIRNLVSIAVTPANPQIPAGQTIPFIAIGSYDDGSTQNLTLTSVWSSSAPAVATINGTGTASGLTAGTSTITASQGGVSGSTTLTVVSSPAPTVVCSVATPLLWPPDHDLCDVGLTLTVTSPGDPRPQVSIKVYSDEPEEAQTADGKFSPDARQFGVTSSGPVPLLIRAERKGNGDGRLYLIVVKVTTASGQTSFHCCPVVVPKSNSKKDKDTILALAAQAEASCGPNGSPLAPYEVGIGPNIGPKQGPSLACLLLSPTPCHLGTGAKKQFTVKGYSGAGNPVSLPGNSSWTTGSSTVSTVNGSGLVTGVGPGSTTLKVTNGGLSAFSSLTVGPTEPTSIVVYPGIASLFQGSGWNYTALAFYPDGTTQDVTGQATWSSSVPAVATVNSAGLVTTLTGGSSTITASWNGLSGTGALTVIPKTPTELILFLPRTTLVINQQEQPSLKAHFNDCSIAEVNPLAVWESSNPGVATVHNGVGYIITRGVGTTTISARMAGLSISKVLTVVDREVVSIAVNPVNAQFRVQQPVQYGVSATWNDGVVSGLPATDLTWSTTGAAATITPQAILTAFDPGQLYVRATLNSNPTVTGFTLATVVPIQLQQIWINPPSTPTFVAGTTQQFSAAGFYSDGVWRDITSLVTWSVYDPRIAQISSTGLLTSYAPGTNYVYASINGGYNYTFFVISPAELTSITVAPPDAQLIVGQLGQYAVTGHYTDGSAHGLTDQVVWSTSDAGIATVNTTGVVTAVAPGTATITATRGVFTSSATLTVMPQAVVSAALVFSNPQVVVGRTFQLQAIGTLNDGSTRDVTGQAVWASSAPAIATVSATGLITGVSAGQATMTGTLGGIVVTTQVTVTAQPRSLTSLSLAPGATQRVVGEVQAYFVTAGYSDGTTEDVTALSTWASLAPAVATVNAAGVAAAVGVGTTQIQATFGGVTVGSTLQVVAAPKTLSSVQVLPGSATLQGGQAGQFVARAVYSDGSKSDVTTQATWLSSVPAVATVGATTGIARALTAGSTTLSATFGGKTGVAALSVTVQTKTLSSIALFPSNPNLPATQTGQFLAVGTYSDGSQQDVTLTSQWSSSAPSVATVSASGLVTGLTIGTTTVTASQGGVSGSTGVTVVPSSPPPSASIPSPAVDSTVTLPVKLVGTASSANFANYTLEYALQGTGQYFRFGGGTAPVVNGELGTFDPTLLENGVYDVRLTVNDTTGQSTSESTQFIVSGRAKIGIFTFSYTDLNIPVQGIPLTVNRTYDSRTRNSSGDFGNGWNLDLRTLKLTQNKEPGRDGWEVLPLQGGLFPSYQLVSNTAHYVTVTLPDGRTEVFDWTPSTDPSTLGQSIWPAPTLVGRTGTTSTLKALGDSEVFIVGENLEDFSFQLYKPVNFELTTKDGTVYFFNLNAGLLQVRDQNGNALNISSAGLTSTAGATVTFTRDASNRITKITDPMGQSLRYAYDGAGNLISSTDRAGNTTTYTYEAGSYLKDIFDPLGRRPIRSEYDPQGRLISTTDANGNQVHYEHLLDTRQEVVRDRNNNQTVYEYDERGNVRSVTNAQGGRRTSTYDANDNEISRTDELGSTTTFTYDAKGNQLSSSIVVNGTAVTTSSTYDSMSRVLTSTDPLGKVTTNIYDPKGNLLTTTDPMGKVTSFTYDAQGRLASTTDPAGARTEFSYDGPGRVTDQRVYSGATMLKRKSFSYDGNGRQIQQLHWNTDPGGNFTTYAVSSTAYDANGQVIQTTDPLGKSTFSLYNAAGQLISSTDKNGNTTTYLYNSLGQLERTQYPPIQVGSTSVVPTDMVGYDPNGNRTTFRDRNGNVTTTEYDTLNRPVKTFNPDGTFREVTYDAAGRVIAQKNELGRVIAFEYDELGRRTATTDALNKVARTVYDVGGRKIKTVDALLRETRFEYDDNGRQTRMIFHDGTSRSTGYDDAGRRTSQTDEAGVTTKYVYAPTGELVEVQQPDPGNPGVQSTVTRYTYDALGRKLTQVDALGRTTRFAYNLRNELVSRKRPMGQEETYTYDSQGNLSTRTSALGQTTRYQYNALHLLSAKLFPDGSSHAFGFFAGGQRSSATLTDASGMSRTTSWALDDHNRMVRQTDPDGAELRWAYDAVGNRTRVATPTLTVDYSYTARNELSQVFRNGNALPWATYNYDDVGNRASLSYVNGTHAEYVYNVKNQLQSIRNANGAATISSYTYALDPRGLRLGVTEESGRSVGYSYDGLRRLTRETIVENGIQTDIAYTLDAVGNRLQKSVTEGAGPARTTVYSYNANDEVATESGPDGLIQYISDANGQTVQKVSAFGSVTYDWDFEGRLVGAASPGQTLAFRYDADGIRTSKSVNGSLTSYLVDKNREYAQVLEERDGSGTPQAGFVYGGDLLSQERSSGVSFYHHDGHMSIRQLTDMGGGLTDRYSYDAFGVALSVSGTTSNDYRYAGEQFESGLGIYYMRARYVDPRIGAFLSEDSYQGSEEDPASLHKYLYVHSNPVSYLDPSGNFFSVCEAMISFAARVAFHVVNFTARIFPALLFTANRIAFWYFTHAVYIELGIGLLNLATMRESAQPLLENNDPVEIQGGSPGDWVERKVGANATYYELIDDFRDGTVTSWKTNQQDMDRLLRSIEKEAETLGNRAQAFQPRNDAPPGTLPIPLDQVRTRVSAWVIPETNASFLTNSRFIQTVTSIQRTTRTVIQVIPLRGWRK